MQFQKYIKTVNKKLRPESEIRLKLKHIRSQKLRCMRMGKTELFRLWCKAESTLMWVLKEKFDKPKDRFKQKLKEKKK